MIWLASFPRSGNTFFRNILYEVYGLESSAYHQESTHPVMNRYDAYPVVKTHLLPGQLIPNNPNLKSVYLIRDGRDTLLSMAHQRKNLINHKASIRKTIKEATLAANNSYFGGWGENVRQWLLQADVVIRFEYLIHHPLEAVEQLRSILDLPQPAVEKLPTFEQLKFGNPKYGSSKRRQSGRGGDNQFFRSGKTKGWKEVFDGPLHELFWKYHGPIMEIAGYQKDGSLESEQLNVTNAMKQQLSQVKLPMHNRPYNKVAQKVFHFFSPPPKRPIEHQADYVFLDYLSKAGNPIRKVLHQVIGQDQIQEVELYGKNTYKKGHIVSGKKLIIGRFSLADFNVKFQSSRKPKIITWFCHPAEMITLEFHAFERELAQMLKEEEREINLRKRMQKSILEYASDHDNRNRWSKFFDHRDMNKVDFVGTNANFENDIKLLMKLLNKEGSLEKIAVEKTLQFRHDFLSTSPEVVELIEKYNEKDIRTYRQAKSLK